MRWYTITLAILFILGCKQNAAPKVFTTYFEVFEPPHIMRGTEQFLTANFKNAVNLYKEESYLSAAEYFLLVSDDTSAKNNMAIFYAGISYLTNQPPDLPLAIKYLTSSSEGDNPYNKKSKWYLALAYIHQGDIDAAIPLLEYLGLSDQNYKGADSRQLLGELN